jgi:hypothetical protein
MAALTAALFGMAAPVARSTGARRAGPSTACILAALVLPPAAAEQPVATTEIIRVEPVDTGEPLTNPGMGWVLYHYDHHLSRYGSRLAPSDTVDEFPGVSVVYMAVPWSFLEPREGEFDWAVIDTPAQRWIDKGKRIALRFTCCEPFYEYATPEWVRDAGAVLHPFATTDRSRRWMRQLLGIEIPERCHAPDYGDPIFLGKYAAFLTAAARRYDGSPDVAFVDVGSFGTWGEGHTALSCNRAYAADVRIKHLELCRAAFPRTLVVAGDDLLRTEPRRDDPELVKRALELGMGLRDDSVLVDDMSRLAESERMAAAFWPTVPVIIEPAHYGQATSWWNTWRDGSPFLESIERYHASYAGVHWWPREFLERNRTLIDRVNRRLGYRLRVVEASWPAVVRAGEPWPFRASWANVGVAACHPGGQPAVTLKDRAGGIVAVLVAEDFPVGRLPPSPPGEPRAVSQESRFRLPAVLGIEPATYDLFVAVGTPDGTPVIALPLPGHDGHRRYRLGAVTVAPEPDGTP